MPHPQIVERFNMMKKINRRYEWARRHLQEENVRAAESAKRAVRRTGRNAA
jgi:hypothetical protein